MPDAVKNEAISQIYQGLRKDREVWLDPEDAMEMARDLAAAGFRKVES